MENTEFKNFELPADVLDEIQHNIESIIESFDIPNTNKMEVIKKINFMYTQTKQMSVTDPLTRLFNRRHFENEFEREFKRAKRYDNGLSLAIIDIDFFKKINDTYGHSCGDFVLKEVAYIMKANFRQTDTLFRYGGEEFVVILTETSGLNAEIPLERLRKRIENNIFIFNNQKINVTVSIGVTSKTDFENYSEMFDNADKALYKAKNDGRNKCCLM
ncbi:GGDEF domain-containing protein [bacterium]|nr:GGDEF domain-containing protein [bacterium]